jgi:hypothetical protein
MSYRFDQSGVNQLRAHTPVPKDTVTILVQRSDVQRRRSELLLLELLFLKRESETDDGRD